MPITDVDASSFDDLSRFLEFVAALGDATDSGKEYGDMWPAIVFLEKEGVFDRGELTGLMDMIYDLSRRANNLIHEINKEISSQQFEDEGWTAIDF